MWLCLVGLYIFGPLKSEKCQICAQKLKLLNLDKTPSLIRGSDGCQVVLEKILNSNQHFWLPRQALPDGGMHKQKQERICVSVLFFLSLNTHRLFFFVVAVLFCTGAAEEWTPACGGTVALRMSTESLLLCRAEWAAEQFIPDRKTVCRVCRVSSSQRLPHGYTAPLAASVCLCARWQTHPWHTSLITEREMKADPRIRSCIKLRHVIPSNGFISLVHYLSQFVAYVCQTEGTLSSLQMFHSDTKTTQ